MSFEIFTTSFHYKKNEKVHKPYFFLNNIESLHELTEVLCIVRSRVW